MILKNKRLQSNITNYVNRALILTLLLILVTGMLSNPAYAKTSIEWFENGNQLLEMGDYTSALEAYNMGIAIDPDYAKAWYNKGNALNNLGRYEEAIKAYDKAIAINPDYAKAWSNKGNALDDLGRYDEAIKAYDRAIAINPDYAHAWYNKGNALNNLGRYEEAIKAYDKAIAINPDYAKAWSNKGNALDDLGRYDEAIKAYDRAIAINPDYAHAWYNKGNALNNLGRYEEAIKAYDKAIAINPDYAEAWSNKGSALDDLGRYDEAIKAYDKAIAINPDYAGTWYNKGRALNNLGRYDEAIKAYDRAIAINPDYGEAWNRKGRALFGLWRYSEAINAYDMAIAIDPENSDAKKLRILTMLIRILIPIIIIFIILVLFLNKKLRNNSILTHIEKLDDGIIEVKYNTYNGKLNIIFCGELVHESNLAFTTRNSNKRIISVAGKKFFVDFKGFWNPKLVFEESRNDYLSKPKNRPISTHGKQCANHTKKSATAICHKCDKLLCNDCTLHHRDGHPYCKDCWNDLVSTKKGSTSPTKSVSPPLNKSSETTPSVNKAELEESLNLPIVEPKPAQQNIVTPSAPVQSSITPIITSAFGYKGATIQYKVKVENPTSEPIADIKVNLYVPDVFLASESTKTITMLKPSESKTVTFEIRPTGECGDCEVSGKVVYYDYSTKKTTGIDIPPKSLSIVCPMLKMKEISEPEWHSIVSNLIETEESTREIDMPAETLFTMTSRIVKDMHMHRLEPEITNSQQLFNGVARFYGVGVKGLKYAAQVEVVGGAKKSRLILKTWAEKEEALTGFYHGLLDEIEKRVHVKGYIDDSIVQNFYHYGDKIGTQVKDSIVQRSNISTGAGDKKCSNCNTVVDASSEFCNKCGEKLNL